MDNPSIIKLKQMKLSGMARAIELFLSTQHHQEMSEKDLITYLVESEWDDRQNKKLQRLIRTAKFRYQAQLEDIIFTKERNLDKNLFLNLSQCNYLGTKENIIITGATGVGKSYIATALGYQACIMGYKTIYYNLGKLLNSLKMKRADGSYIREIDKIEKHDLLILDDFGLSQLDLQSRLDLLEIIEDRYKKRSTIITSQLPVIKWHEIITDSTIADAILDRLIHNSHRVELKGGSLRKQK